MGWVVETSFRPRREFVADLLKPFASETNGTKGECLKHVYRGSPWKGTLYTVWQNTYADGHVVKYGVVYLIELIRHRDERGWGYKDIEASCGPCEVAFPLSWLDGIDLGGYAAGWAERVRAFWKASNEKAAEKRAEKRAEKKRWNV